MIVTTQHHVCITGGNTPPSVVQVICVQCGELVNDTDAVAFEDYHICDDCIGEDNVAEGCPHNYKYE